MTAHLREGLDNSARLRRPGVHRVLAAPLQDAAEAGQQPEPAQAEGILYETKDFSLRVPNDFQIVLDPAYPAEKLGQAPAVAAVRPVQLLVLFSIPNHGLQEGGRPLRSLPSRQSLCLLIGLRC